MQRKLSSFDIYVIVTELQEILDNCIEKIYQISKDEIVIKIKNIQTKEKKQIYIKNGDFLTITNKDFEKPKNPSVFAMTLRKYLSNGRITKISQHEFDRIIIINIGKKQGEYKLIIEFFSDGNIILVDTNGKIINPFIKQSWAHRKLSGRQEYIFPPSQINPFKLNKEKLNELFKESNSDIVRTLAVNVNLSGAIAEEICEIANIDKKIKTENVEKENISDIHRSINSFITKFENKKFNPVFVKEEDKIIDILPFKFKSYNKYSFEKAESFTKGLNFFIKETPEKIKIKESKVDKKLGKLDRQLKMQKEAVKRLEKEIKQKKLEGDLIYLHYQEIEKILNEIQKILNLKDKKDEIEKINNLDIVNKFIPEKNILLLNLLDTKKNEYPVKISFRMSVSKNAEKAYDYNKKLKSKLSGAKKSINVTLDQIKKVEEKKKIDNEKERKKPDKKEKTYWFERFRWFISSNGNLVIGGKDSKSNDIVVKKYLKENDRYAHAEIQGAPSIVIKNKGLEDKKIEIMEKTLTEACIFAASYSKAWKQFAEADAYWVYPEQVSKTAQSGEFVPKGAFIIRGKRNYNRCKLEIAVGEIIIKDTKKIIGGPVSSVENNTNKYVILQPGNTKKNEIAHKLAKIFDVDVNKIDRVLPPGGSTIIKSIGIDLNS